MEENKQSRQSGIFLSLSKLFFTLILFYLGWFQWVFFSIPGLTIALGAGLILFISYHSLIYRKSMLNGITSELLVWFIFSLTSLLTGAFVAVNLEYLTSSLISFLQFLIVIFGMVYISANDRKINFVINIYILFSLVCAITTIFWGTYVYSNRFSMSATTNPNALGMIMVMGILCILYGLDFKKIFTAIIQFGMLFLFIYVIILTGSRKYFISALILLVFWFIFLRKDVFNLVNKNLIIKRALVIIVFIIAIYFTYSLLFDSDLFIRLQQLFDNGDQTRIYMYSTAVELFKGSPIVGIGFNNYRAVTAFQTYSHSTYAEVIATTGLIGTILYFIPFLSLLIKTWFISKTKDILIAKNAKIMGIFLLTLLFLGTGVIHFYELSSNIAFGFIIAFCRLYYRKDNNDVERR